MIADRQGSPTVGVDDADLETLVEVALSAVRAIVAIAVRSLEASPAQVTLVQYRVLATMAQEGPTRPATLANLLGVDASTVTRMCDRLVRDGLVVRRGQRSDRRVVQVALTAEGMSVIDAVTARRREEFATLLRAVPPERRAVVVAGLQEVGATTMASASPPPALGWLG